MNIVTEALRATVSGGVGLPSDEAYEESCRVWNKAVKKRPALIAFCLNPDDVAGAVHVARHHRLKLSVRGGGHDWAGRALCDGGLVIDLTGMRNVKVDPFTRIATVAGGATIKDVASAADAYGLIAALGNCGAVGVAGLTLGGGYGPLNSTLGLAADNLVAAEVVLEDGRRVAASADEAPDLFWALRGGGGNFGVVTSMHLRLHKKHAMLTGCIIMPGAEAQDAMSRYARFAADMPEQMGVSVSIMAGSDGASAVQFVPLWNGDEHAGQNAIANLQSALGIAEPVPAKPTTYADMLAGFDSWLGSLDDHHWAIRTRSLPTLSPGAIAEIVSAVARKESSFAAANWHHLRGAATRVSADATPFGLRQEHFMMELLAAWKPDEDGPAAERWAIRLQERLGAFALPGGYANLLGPDDHAIASQAFGDNAARLRDLKQRFDPHGVFSSAIPLPPDRLRQ